MKVPDCRVARCCREESPYTVSNGDCRDRCARSRQAAHVFGCLQSWEGVGWTLPMTTFLMLKMIPMILLALIGRWRNWFCLSRYVLSAKSREPFWLAQKQLNETVESLEAMAAYGMVFPSILLTWPLCSQLAHMSTYMCIYYNVVDPSCSFCLCPASVSAPRFCNCFAYSYVSAWRYAVLQTSKFQTENKVMKFCCRVLMTDWIACLAFCEGYWQPSLEQPKGC